MNNAFSPTLLSLLNRAKTAAAKQAFIDSAAMSGAGGDPAAAGGGMPPGGDPMAAGGGMPPGGDPMAGGGGGGGGGGGDVLTMLPLIQQAVQQAVAGSGAGGGGGGGAAGGMKAPKIDVNVTLLQILKILARIADALGIQIPATEMVATQGDLTAFAQQQSGGPAAAAGGDAGGAAAAGGQPAIPPIEPMQAATKSSGLADFGTPWPDGQAMHQMSGEAAAIAALLS